jgi:hypothetical protein
METGRKRTRAISLPDLGVLRTRFAQAQRAMKHLRELDPTLRVSNLADWLPIRRPEDLATFAGGLRKAGLPE